MPRPAPDGAGLAELARSGFDQLRATAVTASGMATWLAANGGAAGTVGPSLYAGTAGIGWALARFARRSGASWAADLAGQAITHALRHAEEVPPAHRFGFYSGWSGIAFAAFQVTDLVDDPSQAAAAQGLVEALRAEPPSAEFDLMAGSAGATLAFVLLAPTLGVPAIELAVAAATRLHDTARLRADGSQAAWVPPRPRRCLPLTGLAHGTAGAALALLELWNQRRQDAWLRDLADQAFAYETWLFDPVQANWPDLRHYPTWQATRILPPPQQCAWCHGAGGVALSRLRAHQLTGDPAHASVADTAAHTLASATPPGDLVPGSQNLCHGVPGNAEILALAGRHLHREDLLSASRQLTEASAAHAATMEAASGRWVLEPGLMLGTAGVAWHFLRAAGADTGSPVLPAVT